MQPISGIQQREEDFKPVKEPRAAQEGRHEVELRHDIENVQAFDEQEEEVEIIAVFPADANLIAAISQAIKLLGIRR